MLSTFWRIYELVSLLALEMENYPDKIERLLI